LVSGNLPGKKKSKAVCFLLFGVSGNLVVPFFCIRKNGRKKEKLFLDDLLDVQQVTGEGDDKYLIATAEHPLCAYHLNDWIYPTQLPIRL
jgi:seryl-tRNA synthetase